MRLFIFLLNTLDHCNHTTHAHMRFASTQKRLMASIDSAERYRVASRHSQISIPFRFFFFYYYYHESWYRFYIYHSHVNAVGRIVCNLTHLVRHGNWFKWIFLFRLYRTLCDCVRRLGERLGLLLSVALCVCVCVPHFTWRPKSNDKLTTTMRERAVSGVNTLIVTTL